MAENSRQIAMKSTRNVPPTRTAPDARRAAFSLESLLIVIALCAVAVAVLSREPSLTPLFIVTITFALLRTAEHSAQFLEAGVVLNNVQKVNVLVRSLALVCVLILLAGGTFWAVFYPLARATADGEGFLMAFCVGLVAAGIVLIGIAPRLWTCRSRNTRT